VEVEKEKRRIREDGEGERERTEAVVFSLTRTEGVSFSCFPSFFSERGTVMKGNSAWKLFTFDGKRKKKREEKKRKNLLAVRGGLGEGGLGGFRGFPRGLDVFLWCLGKVGFILFRLVCVVQKSCEIQGKRERESCSEEGGGGEERKKEKERKKPTLSLTRSFRVSATMAARRCLVSGTIRADSAAMFSYLLGSVKIRGRKERKERVRRRENEKTPDRSSSISFSSFRSC
jgi:hypothetical protein